MNFEAPSLCYGTVTQWNYCYYRLGHVSDRLGVKFMVYRESSMTGTYSVVPGSMHVLVANYLDLEANLDLYRGCGNVVLDSSCWFQIQPNDIISACIIEDRDSNIRPLFLTSIASHEAYQMNVDERCIDDQLSVINANQQRIPGLLVRRRLSLHATISKSATLCVTL